MNSRAALVALFSVASIVPAVAQYTTATTYNANVTPNVIYGSGNANGAFAVSTSSTSPAGVATVELGLRAHLRFPPENTFNLQGNNTYVFQSGVGAAPNRPVWNFDWSINTNLTGSAGFFLNQLTYELGVDYDPGAGTNFLTFDPINGTLFADHSFGTNATGNGAGAEAANAAGYSTLITGNYVAQNSWTPSFFTGPLPFDPNTTGTYEIYLRWFSSGTEEAGRTTINVQVIPEPTTYAMLLSLGALGIVALRRRWRGNLTAA